MNARKRFGQHFLTDDCVLDQIIAAIGVQPGDHIVEIGPGRGALTQHLLRQARHLDVIEIDRDLAVMLQQGFGSAPHFTLHSGDVLRFDWNTLKANAPLRIVGNLPYNITTPLLFQLFELSLTSPSLRAPAKQSSSEPRSMSELDCFAGARNDGISRTIQDMHFLLQKEVVERLTAPAGSTHYGRLTVMAQYFAQLTELFDVPPEAFSPRPRVQSAFIRIEPYAVLPSPANDFAVFSEIVKEAFTYRRKILANSLRKFVTADALESLNIDPSQRPQEITVENFVKISNIVHLT